MDLFLIMVLYSIISFVTLSLLQNVKDLLKVHFGDIRTDDFLEWAQLYNLNYNPLQFIMFELKGRFLTSRYYARKIPFISRHVYEMSHVEKSSFFYKTIPYPTRLIDLQNDFQEGYSKRLQNYFRQADDWNLEIRRPEIIPDLMEMYQQVIDAKNLNPLLPGTLRKKSNYYYSMIYHLELGRLAAHLNIGDWEVRRVYGYINASAFRSFTDKNDQQMCSTANKYLYHRDMVYFKSMGYRYFDMVGTKEPMNQMKKQFGGEIVMTYTHVPYPVYISKALKRTLSKL